MLLFVGVLGVSTMTLGEELRNNSDNSSILDSAETTKEKQTYYSSSLNRNSVSTENYPNLGTAETNSEQKGNKKANTKRISDESEEGYFPSIVVLLIVFAFMFVGGKLFLKKKFATKFFKTKCNKKALDEFKRLVNNCFCHKKNEEIPSESVAGQRILSEDILEKNVDDHIEKTVEADLDKEGGEHTEQLSGGVLGEKDDEHDNKKSEEEQKQKYVPHCKADYCGFAYDTGKWSVVGASVQGNGHIKASVPCQDFSLFEDLGDGWGISITSDGAGSAKNSHLGSKLTAQRALCHFKTLIDQEGWKVKECLPDDIQWMHKSFMCLKNVYGELAYFAKQKEIDLKSLSATVIVVIHSPFGLLAVHVGDGRAGYQSKDGNWYALITPHKGEEANQTLFMTSEFWNIPFYMTSEVFVPESIVVREPVEAYTLMSDGCEKTTWECYQQDKTTGRYCDPNKPYAPFFNPISKKVLKLRESELSLKERGDIWADFIFDGNDSFVKETDDKTLILVVNNVVE